MQPQLGIWKRGHYAFKIYLLFFQEFPKQFTYYSQNYSHFLILFQNNFCSLVLMYKLMWQKDKFSLVKLAKNLQVNNED